jgi:hypothetical protein
VTKLVLLAAAAAALALPAAPALAECRSLASAAGATGVELCQRRVWERTYVWVECGADTNADGTRDVHCPVLVEIKLEG